MKEFRKKMDELNIIIRDITNILNVVSENMEIYYKITYDIAYNYNKKKKNYEVLKNVSSIRDFINISEINDILGNNINYKKKFDILMNIYNKMNNIKVTEEIKSDKKNDNNEIKNKKKEGGDIKKIQKVDEEKIEIDKIENKLKNIEIINISNISQIENERIINCKTLKKTMLNDKKLEIRIDEPKPEKNNLLYKVQTKPFGWIVYRSFSDFENLRKLIAKFFPEFYIPFLQDANAAENKEKENEYSKTIQCLNLFMNQLVKNESFKTSVVLLAFLSYANKTKFDNVIKENSQKK